MHQKSRLLAVHIKILSNSNQFLIYKPLKNALKSAKLIDMCRIEENPYVAYLDADEAEKLGLPKKSYVPQTLEEKIVAHADNLISGSKEVDIDFVIKKWKRRIEDSEDNIERLIKLDDELIKAFED